MRDYFLSNKIFFYVLGVISLCLLFYDFFINAPANFPNGVIFEIKQGSSLRGVSLELKNSHIIRSRIVFEAFVIILGRERNVISTDYYFDNKIPVYEVARRISKGERHLAAVKVTIPEGFNVSDIAQIVASKLPSFNKEKFLLEARDLEGYLFPDTYFFLTTEGEGEVLKSMRDNFEKKISLLRSQIITSGKNEKEIITMASLIEGEAKGDNDREVISGILWKRLNIDMPLQVDVAPETYKVKGLPKNPIGNPGIEAIKAAIYPKSSSYLYYLHDKNGSIHYAKNFTEHRKNILKYLK